MHPREHNPGRSSMLLWNQVSVTLLLQQLKLATGHDAGGKNILLKALIFHLCRLYGVSTSQQCFVWVTQKN